MATTINVTLSNKSIRKAQKDIQRYKQTLIKKLTKFTKRLAEEGFDVADMIIKFAPANYGLGTLDLQAIKPKAKVEGDRVTAEIVLQGADILFIEFGTGIRYSSVEHPKANELGYGAGTYPGKGHWDDPQGWWFTDEVTRESKHTYGNPALMPAYQASTQIELRVARIAREVFG